MTTEELKAWVRMLRTLNGIIHSYPVVDRAEAIGLQQSYDRLFDEFGEELARAAMDGEDLPNGAELG